MEIQVFVQNKNALGEKDSNQGKQIMDFHCTADVYINMIEILRKEREFGTQISNEELTLLRLATALEISETTDHHIVVNDSCSLINLMEGWMRYQEKITPLVIIGNHLLKGIPSVLELVEAILTNSIDDNDWNGSFHLKKSNPK